MSQPKQLEAQIRSCRTRLIALGSASPPLPFERGAIVETLEDLLVALEELQTTWEELRGQNLELEFTRQGLDAERKRYRELFELSPDGYLVTDCAGIIQEANHAAGALFNMQTRELVGKPVALFVAKEHRRVFYGRLGRLALGGSWEIRMQPRGLEPFDAIVSVGAHSDSGLPSELRWTVRDITERRRAEHALEEQATRLRILHTVDQAILAVRSMQEIAESVVHHLRTILGCKRVSVLVFDNQAGEATILAVSQAGETQVAAGLRRPLADFNLPPELHEGRSQLEEHVLRRSPNSPESINAEIDLALAREGIRSRLHVPLCAGGELIGCLCLGASATSAFPPDRVEIAGQVAASLAVALRSAQLNEERRASHEKLERLLRLLGQRTAVAEKRSSQLRMLAAELTHAEHRERRRLAVLLHDHLQQILAAARMSLDQLGRRLSDESGRECLAHTEELLDQSIEASRTLAVEISPPILFEGGLIPALGLLGRLVRGRHGLDVELRLDPAAEPAADDVRIFLYHAARELLFNVVRHADVDSAVLELDRRDDALLCMTVIDHGRGFQPSDPGAQANVGGGFGLYAIRERLELVGGRMEVTSSPGEGTRIALYAPVASIPADLRTPLLTPRLGLGGPPGDEPAQAPPEIEGRAGSAGRIRVLVVDDHRIVRQGIAGLLLEEPDIEVVGEAADGTDAVDEARRVRPDVVLMDISMPRMNGIEATRRIKAENPEVQVIGLSMHEDEHMAQEMHHAGASRFLTKGGPAEDLIAAIRLWTRPQPTPAPERRGRGAGVQS